MILRYYRILHPKPVPRFSRRVRYRLALVAYAAILFGVAIVATWGMV